MIQQTLQKHFTGSTVIMIAHRITSVLDSDMVLVLEQGLSSNFVNVCLIKVLIEVVFALYEGLIDEYDSPTKLLEDKASSFAKLVAEYSTRSSSSFENITPTL